jgi:hypothetical protein
MIDPGEFTLSFGSVMLGPTSQTMSRHTRVRREASTELRFSTVSRGET